MASCRQRVAIITLSDLNDPKHIQQAVFVNGLYAARHNYAFIVERCSAKQNVNKKWVRHGWEKPFYIKRYLRDFDWVLFVDKSLMFVDHSQKIEQSMGKFLDSDTCIVVSHDTRLMLFKSSAKAFEVLDDWQQAPLTTVCDAWRNADPYEKACFERLRKEKYLMQTRAVTIAGLVMNISNNPSQVSHRLGMLVSSSDDKPTTTHPPPIDAFTQETTFPWSAFIATCLTILLAWHIKKI